MQPASKQLIKKRDNLKKIAFKAKKFTQKRKIKKSLIQEEEERTTEILLTEKEIDNL